MLIGLLQVPLITVRKRMQLVTVGHRLLRPYVALIGSMFSVVFALTYSTAVESCRATTVNVDTK